MLSPYYDSYWLIQNELEHHGVKGQSWGKRNGPPYPLSRGKDGRVNPTQKKKKQSLIARMKAEHQKKVKAKQRAKAKAEKAKQAAKEKKENLSNEELREKLLNSTDPKFLAQHMDLLKTNEIKERLDRIDTEKKLKNLLKDDSGKKKVESGMKMIENISKIAETTSKAANAYSAVYDATQKKSKRDEERKAAANLSKDNKVMGKYLKGIVDTYTSQENSADIKVNFDPKTGKLTFETMKKKKKDKKEDEN